jgi:serine/threonine-protein kinase HipA
MAKASTLVVWANGVRVGAWTQTRGAHLLQYEPAWLESPASRPLSLSLPFTPANLPHRGAVVANFFDNLLPDSDDIRSRLRAKFNTASTSTFDLLTAIGRDCVGAVQLLPENEEPVGFDEIHGKQLSDAEVQQAIAASLSGARTFGQSETEGFRISLAGAQEKTALLFHRGRWCRPLGPTPTTHIFKLPLGLVGHLQMSGANASPVGRSHQQMDMGDPVENEWLCLHLMQAFGLQAPACEILTFDSRKVLSVERFDRARQDRGRWIARLPQEDLCQVLGLPHTRRYEAEGGPGMRDILRILDSSSRATEDKRAFVKAQIIFWMLAATDGHAKNFSIFHERGATYRLTPFYDVLSAWPVIGRGAKQLDWHKAKMAMAVRSKNPRWKLADIQPRHWDFVTRSAGLGSATSLLQEIVNQTPHAVESANRQIPARFPAVVRDKIFEGLQRAAAQVADGL